MLENSLQNQAHGDPRELIGGLRRLRRPVGAIFRGNADQGNGEMERLETRLEGPVLVRPVVHGDARGFFHESYRRNVFTELGIPDEFVQDNHSRSNRGIVRGMHFQVGAGMAKLVRCSYGAIVDAVVDLRRGSPTYGEWETFELNENLHQLYCPIGFAHGFCVVSDMADVMYKCSAYYDESIERGIKYDDPEIGIAWPDVELEPSARDAAAPLLRDIEDELPFRYGT
jgi:dTDP-4-dehydrorhamnose 3,5-epimerase